MKKLSLEIGAMALLLFIICLATRLTTKNTFTAYLPLDQLHDFREEIHLAEGEPPLVTFEEAEIRNGYMKVEVHPQKPGDVFAELTDSEGEVIYRHEFQIGPMMTVFNEETGGFTGDTIALASIAAFFLYTAFLLVRYFIFARGQRMYSYHAMYCAGFSFFSLCTGMLFLSLTIQKIFSPEKFTMNEAYETISRSSYHFIRLTFPCMIIFAVLMALSNIELIRHEGKRPVNLLGIGISVLLLAGEGLARLMYEGKFIGSPAQMHIRDTINGVYTTGFVFFECMLLGAMICGIRAAVYEPAPDKDCIIILGCSFRKDGTLTPLLRGRVDRAVKFWKKQKEQAGKTAYLIPSGGQGKNEVMPEAKAMKRYLVNECRIPEEYIIEEDQSMNTYQNMAFSKRLIEERIPSPKAAFATTNYHVFRSGVWARLAGLDAEGVGSRTKWWFWPNAFMRECIGLMRNHVRQELTLLVLLNILFASLSFALE